MTLTVRRAVDADLDGIHALLVENALPVADLPSTLTPVGATAPDFVFLLAEEDGRPIGMVGLQCFGESALLRSLAVVADRRGTGLGDRLVVAVEDLARELGIAHLVLLTRTAEAFFARRGYATQPRDSVATAVLASAEFHSLCPASATCMGKSLQPSTMIESTMTGKKRVLFVCVENSNRSQMAEAFARIHGGDDIEALSAGSRPSGRINPKAIRFMGELDYDLTGHASKSLDEIDGDFDAVITMGCGDNCPWVPAKRREDWALPDPRDMDDEGYRKVRDEISARVRALLAEL